VRTRLAGAFALLAFFAPPGHAQSKQPLELAVRLYERAAIAAQVQPIPSQFEQGLQDYRDKIPGEVIAVLVEAGKRSFAEPALRKDIVSAIAQNMKAADIKRTLAWLDTPAGRRVTRAEAKGAASMSQESMQAYFDREKQKPPTPKRDAMIADLITATKSVEIGAGFIEATSLGIAVGMDATQPVEKRIGVAGLRARLRAVMPPEKLRADMGAMLPPMFGYVYRDTSDADLAAYVKFSSSPAGRRYNEAVSTALIGALARASVRVGEMLPSSAEKKQI
jgi:hypothetical protein